MLTILMKKRQQLWWDHEKYLKTIITQKAAINSSKGKRIKMKNKRSNCDGEFNLMVIRAVDSELWKRPLRNQTKKKDPESLKWIKTLFKFPFLIPLPSPTQLFSPQAQPNSKRENLNDSNSFHSIGPLLVPQNSLESYPITSSQTTCSENRQSYKNWNSTISTMKLQNLRGNKGSKYQRICRNTLWERKQDPIFHTAGTNKRNPTKKKRKKKLSFTE